MDWGYRGIDPFPSRKASGSGLSFIHENGVTISHWQGVFTPEEDVQEKEELRFKGRDTSKNDKFIVLRTYFTDSERLQLDEWFGMYITRRAC